MNVAFLPVRGGSKSIPLKNIKLLCGKPLVYWTVLAACQCRHIDKVYVATDSAAIREAVNEFSKNDSLFDNLEVIGRSEASATDSASTEYAMLEFAEKYDFDNIVLIQATSPLLTSNDLNKGFEAFAFPDVDSVFSAVKQKRFNWSVGGAGFANPINYDVFKRPRRQDFSGYFVENGAFYITSRKNLLASKNRLSGNIMLSEMPEDTFFEIDEPDDWIVIENLMKKRINTNDNKRGCLKAFFTDCDGCLTDAGMYYTENGDEFKKFNSKDGMGFKVLRENGILTGIITGESVELNRRRAEKLKVDVYIPGCSDKLEAIRKICDKYHLSMQEIAYMGDDINDLPVLQKVGCPLAPADAISSVKETAGYVTHKRGGDGAVREAIDWLRDKRYIKCLL